MFAAARCGSKGYLLTFFHAKKQEATVRHQARHGYTLFQVAMQMYVTSILGKIKQTNENSTRSGNILDCKSKFLNEMKIKNNKK
jgi:hypothetical protein